MDYEVNWKGLDQGVEHTWTPEVLITGLKLIKLHQPITHRDPDSKFYTDIENEFPDKTWRAYDSKDGSFRPIFRRSNTWKKLGLINEVEKEFTLSLAGKKLLSGEISLNEVYANVCANHDEDNEKPFVILASLILSLTQPEFSTDDIMLVLHHWRPGDKISPQSVLNKPFSLDRDYKSSELYKTRKRRVNSMLKLLSSMGALARRSKNFSVKSEDLLLEVAGEGQMSGIDLEIEFEEKVDFQTRPKAPKVTQTKRIVKADRSVSDFTSLAASEKDPMQRLRLLERATKLHEKTIGTYAKIVLDEFGLTSYENTSGYDIVTEVSDSFGVLVEVKTVTSRNINKQIREAVSQVYEYRFRYSSELPSELKLVILLDCNPKSFLSDWVSEYLATDRNISLWWIEDDRIVSDNLSLPPSDIFSSASKA